MQGRGWRRGARTAAVWMRVPRPPLAADDDGDDDEDEDDEDDDDDGDDDDDSHPRPCASAAGSRAPS